jgi:hypothetical protein
LRDQAVEFLTTVPKPVRQLSNGRTIATVAICPDAIRRCAVARSGGYLQAGHKLEPGDV